MFIGSSGERVDPGRLCKFEVDLRNSLCWHIALGGAGVNRVQTLANTVTRVGSQCKNIHFIIEWFLRELHKDDTV